MSTTDLPIAAETLTRVWDVVAEIAGAEGAAEVPAIHARVSDLSLRELLGAIRALRAAGAIVRTRDGYRHHT